MRLHSVLITKKDRRKKHSTMATSLTKVHILQKHPCALPGRGGDGGIGGGVSVRRAQGKRLLREGK
jgi:hypothetical protein